MTELDLHGPHWRFAIATYSDAEVQKACLALQERHGVDVNVLLVTLWAACECGVRIDATEISALDRKVAPLRENAVLGLRRVRRWMKTAGLPAESEIARTIVKKAEIAVEQFEQALLAAEVVHWQRSAGSDRVSAIDTAQAVVAFYASRTGTEDRLRESDTEMQQIARVAARRDPPG